MIAISLIGSVVLTAILLKIVSSVLPDFEMDGMWPAFVAVFIASVAGMVVQFSLPLVGSLPAESWTTYVLSPALSIVTLAIGITFASGIQAGLLSTLAAAVLVTAVSSGLTYAIVPLLPRGLTL